MLMALRFEPSRFFLKGKVILVLNGGRIALSQLVVEAFSNV